MRSRAIAALSFIWVISSSAAAGEFDDAISAAFPGYRIVQPSERDLAEFPGMFPGVLDELRNAPAVVVGQFNGDKFKDFAAYILDPTSKRRLEPPSPRYPDGVDTYKGGLVVCFGQEAGRYRCRRPLPYLNEVALPHSWYLKRIPPRKLDCPGRGRVSIKTDALGWWPVDGAGGGIMVFEQNGSSLDCSFGFEPEKRNLH